MKSIVHGLAVIQNNDITIQMHADEKIELIEAFPSDRHLRKMTEDTLNPIELHSFRSANSSIRCTRIAASPLCSLYDSLLQQKAHAPIVHDLVFKFNLVKLLQITTEYNPLHMP